MFRLLIFIMTIVLSTNKSCAKDRILTAVGPPVGRAHPCKGVDDIEAVYAGGLPPEEENQYQLHFYMPFPKYGRVVLKFDSEATVTLTDKTQARISGEVNKLEFSIYFFKNANHLSMQVKGPASGTVPYLTSIDMNLGEYCKEPNIGFLDNYLIGYKDTAHVALAAPQGVCGRRKVVHTGLIVNGQPTKPGDWPWHAALYRLEYASLSYICGGTLISKNFVLTAAHCVTIHGVPVLPEVMSVIFGKYNLKGGDIAAQEREVLQIIVHEEYRHKRLDNDIALLKLRTEAIYDDYVQPACIWDIEAIKKLPAGIVYGTVVGWGFNHTNQLASTLHQVSLPRIADVTCLKANPDFFGKVLNYRKFCAGYRNGTSACNGDSGGGYMVFVPDISGDTSANATGSWYVHGIVSLALAQKDRPICDPFQFTLFTDVPTFVGWIAEHLKVL